MPKYSATATSRKSARRLSDTQAWISTKPADSATPHHGLPRLAPITAPNQTIW
ncbi:hypothetical protein D3C71_2130730 [compost metagenome]